MTNPYVFKLTVANVALHNGQPIPTPVSAPKRRRRRRCRRRLNKRNRAWILKQRREFQQRKERREFNQRVARRLLATAKPLCPALTKEGQAILKDRGCLINTVSHREQYHHPCPSIVPTARETKSLDSTPTKPICPVINHPVGCVLRHLASHLEQFSH